jgi:hypothetical protein
MDERAIRSLSQTMRPVAASGNTGSAEQTLLGGKENLLLALHAFGVVAPCAAEGTALEEDDCPDPRPVARTAALDAEDRTPLRCAAFRAAQRLIGCIVFHPCNTSPAVRDRLLNRL